MTASHQTTTRNRQRAPHVIGALFLLAACLFTACKNEEPTPEWSGPEESTTQPAETPAPVPPETVPPEPVPPEPVPVPGDPTTGGGGDETDPTLVEPEPEPEPEGLRFLSYNLKNYLRMPRYKDGERIGEADKPEEEKEALVRMIAATNPDVLGFCEIGLIEDLRDLQNRLKKAGLDLPHFRHAGGKDETRHLGLLSRHPILPAGPAPHLAYKLQGKDMIMSRGILDAAIDIDGRQFRFLGVHLKSKREIPEADQELMRRNEAYLLRKHVDKIFAENPAPLLVIYGDLNDTRRTTPIRSIQGAYRSPSYLEAVHHADSRGEVWTHFWEYQHSYARFDYVLVSKPLRKAIDKEGCRILDDALWSTASDHRALLTTFELDQVPVLVIAPKPAPKPSPEPAPKPSPEPIPEPAPEPSPEPAPEPSPEPSPEPDLEPVP